jgi:hypothetical protein
LAGGKSRETHETDDDVGSLRGMSIGSKEVVGNGCMLVEVVIGFDPIYIRKVPL